MKSIIPRYAGIVAAVLAIILIAGIFAMLGTVDLVFVEDGYEVRRQENVSVFTEIEANDNYSYVYGGNTYTIADNKLKEHIVSTVLVNAVTFNWDQEANDITVTVK
jgi:hypothetical protein